MQLKTTCLLLLITISILSCTNADKQTPQGPWSSFVDGTGTYSSARMVDLNNDKILDVVIGAGGKEEKHSDTAVIAMDGATGKILWSIPAENQYVGSAVFTDITGDNIPDVFIGGRWALFTAINGADGKTIWTFYPERTKTDGSDGGWYNFTTPQFVPDQDGDGIQDLLAANGGDARAAPGDSNRPAGRLLVLSSKTGKILANVVVPDHRETYMSVVVDKKGDKDMTVLFGTGGETLPGHLFRTTLQDIMKGDISNAKVIAASSTKGFVSSPVMVDINNDKINDVVVNAVDGRMLAIDGASDSLVWQVSFPGTEAYTIPAIGNFNDDPAPDFFANFAIGEFPKLQYSLRFMADGKTGKIEFQDTIPAFQYASGITADLNEDGFDELIVNQSVMKRTQFENVFFSRLMVFDYKNNKNFPIGDSLPGTNLASTPWIGDMDNDGHLDIICSSVLYDNAAFDLQQPRGLYIRRYIGDFHVKRPVRWGAFMGSNYTGVY